MSELPLEEKSLMRNLPSSMIVLTVISLLLACGETNVEQKVDRFEYDLPEGGTYTFQAVNENIIQVRFTNDSIKSDQVYAPQGVLTSSMKYSETTQKVVLRTASVRVEIEKDNHLISYYNQEELKLVDKGGLLLANDSSYYQFELGREESIYGTGFRALPLNRRGEKLLVYNRPQYGYGWGEKNLNYTIPHWTSSRNYGLLIDNPARAQLDIGATDSSTLTYASKGGNLAYYFINGDNQKELLKQLTTLTGTQPLPPRWAFGNLQSRFGYRSQQEAEEILDKSLLAGYPVEAIILDIYWFGPELEDGQMGRLDWDRERWPDPKGMIDRFREKGVKTIVVTEPFFTRKSKHYSYLSDQNLLAKDSAGKTYDIEDFYFGVGGLLDVFKPEAKEWMWDRYKYIRSFGVDGLWVDLGEPEKHPHDMIHVNGRASQIHGVYGHEWSRMLYDGYGTDYPQERLFHMGRSGFVGTQRFGLIPWTGDVGRGWSGLQAQIPSILSMGMSGLGYMHSDAGGFSMIDEGDPVLYIRWLQLSTFTSIFRPHADAVVPPEPIFWDLLTQLMVRRIIELRYALLPYHYTLAYENSTEGLPFVRPMFMEFPEASDTLYQQFMYGQDLLVAPIIDSSKNSRKRVVFPTGEWYDYFRKKKFQGGKDTVVAAAVNDIPLFAKAGAIIPTAINNTSANTFSGDSLKISYFVSSQASERTFYFDDGKDPTAIKDNQHELLKSSVDVENGVFSFELRREGYYAGSPISRSIFWEVVGLKKKPTVLPEGADWDERTKVLTYQLELEKEATWAVKK